VFLLRWGRIAGNEPGEERKKLAKRSASGYGWNQEGSVPWRAYRRHCMEVCKSFDAVLTELDRCESPISARNGSNSTRGGYSAPRFLLPPPRSAWVCYWPHASGSFERGALLDIDHQPPDAELCSHPHNAPLLHLDPSGAFPLRIAIQTSASFPANLWPICMLLGINRTVDYAFSACPVRS
jgi:hypothetical protein